LANIAWKEPSMQCLPKQIHMKEPKLEAGDTVRLAMNRLPFQKGYLPGWTDELLLKRLQETFLIIKSKT